MQIANIFTDSENIHLGKKMPEFERTSDDEIDPIELFEILWNSKLFILVVTALATIIGVVFAQFSKPIHVVQYKITVPYVFTLKSIGLSNATKMGFIVDPLWVITSTQFEKSDQKPKDPMVYVNELNKVNDALTSEVLAEAHAELAFMKTAMNEMVQLSSSETFLSDFLKVRKLIFNIENGTKVMRLGDVSIDENKPQPSKEKLKIAFAFFLGLFASMAWVLSRHALVQSHK